MRRDFPSFIRPQSLRISDVLLVLFDHFGRRGWIARPHQIPPSVVLQPVLVEDSGPLAPPGVVVAPPAQVGEDQPPADGFLLEVSVEIDWGCAR